MAFDSETDALGLQRGQSHSDMWVSNPTVSEITPAIVPFAATGGVAKDRVDSVDEGAGWAWKESEVAVEPAGNDPATSALPAQCSAN